MPGEAAASAPFPGPDRQASGWRSGPHSLLQLPRNWDQRPKEALSAEECGPEAPRPRLVQQPGALGPCTAQEQKWGSLPLGAAGSDGGKRPLCCEDRGLIFSQEGDCNLTSISRRGGEGRLCRRYPDDQHINPSSLPPPQIKHLLAPRWLVRSAGQGMVHRLRPGEEAGQEQGSQTAAVHERSSRS